MKLSIKKIALGLCLSTLAATSFAAAKAHVHSFGKGDEGIHTTHFHTDGSLVHVMGTLYFGNGANGSCQKIEPIANVESYYDEGDYIAADASLFQFQKLTDQSCAVEEFITDDSVVHATEYKLINDGTIVTAADPKDTDVNLSQLKK